MRTIMMALAIGLLATISTAEAQCCPCCRKSEGSQHGCHCGAMSATRANQPAKPMEKTQNGQTAKAAAQTAKAATQTARAATQTAKAATQTAKAATQTAKPETATGTARSDEAGRPAGAAMTARMGQGRGGMRMGMGMRMGSDDHNAIHVLLSQHRSITRVVEEIPGGVRTTTTTDRPELVRTLRTHVRQMAQRLEEGRPIRMWDPVFREVFANADEITLKWKDIERGIEVTETSDDPDVVPLIRAHARKVNDFVAGGHAAARPPWAGGPRR